MMPVSMQMPPTPLPPKTIQQACGPSALYGQPAQPAMWVPAGSAGAVMPQPVMPQPAMPPPQQPMMAAPPNGVLPPAQPPMMAAAQHGAPPHGDGTPVTLQPFGPPVAFGPPAAAAQPPASLEF